ncbi:hypothetical protein QYE76_003582 [Lolium multiflorum]|uniref:WRKY domain-containing protein n=1 Tax=Lolium multiflorum TaxID=4521 RepID=A0AAD8VZD3_LOLMU|nr:hypothetical protein QYE76_003582 [Lolium multiflorum]
MQLNRGAVGGGHACGTPDATQLRCRERELVAQLHELLFPSTPPSPAGGGASWSSSAAELSVEHCGSPVKAPTLCGRRRGRGSKRVREGGPQEEQKQRGGSSAETKAARGRRKKEGTTTKTIVTTVPDFDGYQWKKYGQKQIEAAQYPRSYYRCTNSADQACPAKRTVQRNDDGDGDGGRPPKYTVVYISEHSCKLTEAAAAPVILETTVGTKAPAAPDTAAVFSSSSSAFSNGTQSPASSDGTWSDGTVSEANPVPRERGDCSSLFDVDGDYWEWDPSPTAPAAALLQDMDFARPIMSPVHIAATDGSWINDLFFNESPFVLNSCQLFGY